MEKKYRYLGFFLLLLIPLTLLGFYRTYFGLAPEFNEQTDIFIHLHAFIATIWILLLITQPFLIQYQKLKAHRLLGKLSFVIFPLLVLSFIPQMVKNASSGHSSELFFPVRDTLMLSLFYGLAIYHKRNSSLHMRYMIVSAMVFLFPTIGRISYAWFHVMGGGGTHISYVVIYAVLIGLIFYDKVNQKSFQPYLVAMACMVVSHGAFFLVFR
ncbi:MULTISPECIES: hypothetical protein [unclassified Imperialibacter]|uniref:hypothetical protein n=1 Tax=unclassified Imperialibacter TaxID=2629706 RepID=UPI0012569A35|nr:MULTISPECIES: hypothetical protein [unclassified Imperialibacter]CAD5268935.1 conserved membrane hypothetical protein [Imperialibacter sp. 75]CAD5300034.1 conserved membrane hypothetical protein [Imperialibacter sp. 89]VVT22019.1 conserved membrane hypothetical protein [Imperialibacter sp. EC-SDR9]